MIFFVPMAVAFLILWWAAVRQEQSEQKRHEQTWNQAIEKAAEWVDARNARSSLGATMKDQLRFPDAP